MQTERFNWLVKLLLLGGCAAGPADSEGNSPNSLPEVSIKESGATENSTTTIPRYKIFQNPANPSELWVAVAVESGADTYRSEDGGRTWKALGSLGWEFHMSMAGNAEGFIHFVNRGTPAATYHRLNRSSFEQELLTEFADYGNETTSGNVAVNGSEVVVFTRSREDNRRPITYHRSVDNGATWTTGLVPGTGNSSADLHRIGSAVIENRVTLVYWRHRGGPSGDLITLHRWNGETFEELAHPYATEAESPWTRQFSLTVDSNESIHLVSWDLVNGARVVRHSHRKRDEPWSRPETVAAWENDDIHPQLSAYGDRVLLLYLYSERSTRPEDGQVYYRVWDPVDGWVRKARRLYDRDRRRVRYPTAPQVVVPSSPFIPVIWTQGGAVKYVPLFLNTPAGTGEE